MRENRINLPDCVSPELAELIGAHIGDGNISTNHGHRINIFGHMNKDLDYLNYLCSLFVKVFEIKPRLHFIKQRNAAYIQLHSKTLCEFLHTRFAIPLGRKGEIDIPEEILKDEDLVKACIKGIFDTDGSVSIQKSGKYNYPFIAISTTSQKLAKTILEKLKNLGFQPYISITKPGVRRRLQEFSVRVKGFGEVAKWKKFIGSSNPRNMTKLHQIT
jgi:DNA-binding transcriptional regulator WhiA